MEREKEERLSAALYSFPSASAFDDFKKSDDWKRVRCKEPFKAKCTDKSNYKQISFKFSSSSLTNQTRNTVLTLRVSIVTTIFSFLLQTGVHDNLKVISIKHLSLFNYFNFI